MERESRPLTLTGAIINLVFNVLSVAGLLYSFVVLGALMPIAYIVIFVLIFALVCAAMILSSVLIAKSSTSRKEYDKFSGVVIALFVLDALLTLIYLFAIFRSNIVCLIGVLVYALCATFILVDFFRNKSALKNPQSEEAISAQQKLQTTQNIKDETRKRPLTMAGGIVNIVFASLDIIFMILFMILTINVLNLALLEDSTDATLMAITLVCVFAVLEILFAITIIVLASILVYMSSKTVREYHRKRGVAIALFVFNCLTYVNLVTTAVLGNYLAILMMLVYVMCATFVMIDICRNKKAVDRLDGKIPENPIVQIQSQPVMYVQPVSAPQEKPNVEEKPKTTPSKLLKNLTELKQMKEDGIITETEYNKLKAKVIEKADF